MTTLKAYGTLQAASTTDRVLRYLLLPYGEAGYTSMGKVTASAGAVELPDDATTLVGNLEHEGTRPVSRALELSETSEGLALAVRVLPTTSGDDLLVEAAEGVRTGVSVEVANPVIRAGALIGGTLTGYGHVTTPAFASAQLAASDYGETTVVDLESTTTYDDGVQVTTTEHRETTYEVTDPEDETDPETDQGDEPTNQEDDTMGATARAQAGGLAASATPTKGITKGELFKMLASAHRRGGERALYAALADIVPTDVVGLEQPQYVGELWNGKAYQRKIIPLFNHDTLTSFEVKGWRWLVKPTVSRYTGNKTAVPSNPGVKTEQVPISAERIAGAHDIDRKFRDFNDEAFFAAYFAAMTESYARVSDLEVLSDVIAAATPVTRGSIPAGVSAGMVSVADGALAVLNATDTMPTFAIVATDLWREIFLTREEDKLAYLNAAMGLEDGTVGTFRFAPSAQLDPGEVLVGTRAAVTVHELGEVPIRVEAQNIAQGGIDEGVFGYYAVNVHDADGLALVTPPAP